MSRTHHSKKITKKDMSLIKKSTNRDIMTILVITFLLITLVNFTFVYYSPKIVKNLPVIVAGSILPCYRTLYHYDGKNLSQTNFVFGDSFSEGAGDEFLSSDPEYGIFNKLKDTKSSALIFGRGGYGNIGTVMEFKHCYPLLSTYTDFNTDEIIRSQVTFVFYEGNDLNNNLVEKERKFNELTYKIRFFLPVYEFMFKELRRLLKIFGDYFNDELEKPKNENPLTNNFFEAYKDTYPQSAATELNDDELDKSVNLLMSSLDSIKTMLPDAYNFLLLYIPSVTSSYEINGKLKVQSYQGNEYFETTGEFNDQRSRYIREVISSYLDKNDWHFCDATSSILSLTREGIPVHGPLDWKHLNKKGYHAVAYAYSKCLDMIKT